MTFKSGLLDRVALRVGIHPAMNFLQLEQIPIILVHSLQL